MESGNPPIEQANALIRLLNVDDLTLAERMDDIPSMPESQWPEFHDDIGANGVKDPCLVREGVLYDGRCRLKSSKIWGFATIPCIEFEGTAEQALEEMYRRAFIRRRMTDDQITMAVVSWSAGEAARSNKEKAKKAGGAKGKKTVVDTASAEAGSEPQPRIRERAARIAGVSKNKIRQGKLVYDADSELAKQVLNGTQSLRDALRRLRKSTKKKPGTGHEKLVKNAIKGLCKREKADASVAQHLWNALGERALTIAKALAELAESHSAPLQSNA